MFRNAWRVFGWQEFFVCSFTVQGKGSMSSTMNHDIKKGCTKKQQNITDDQNALACRTYFSLSSLERIAH